MSAYGSLIFPKPRDKHEEEFYNALRLAFDGMAEKIDSNGFIDRGDPTAYDWTEATLTADGAWHDLDLSSIIDEGTKAVQLTVEGYDDSLNAIYFRKKGNANSVSKASWYNPIINQTHSQDLIVACDINGVIEYWMSAVVWTSLDITVKGWWKYT